MKQLSDEIGRELCMITVVIVTGLVLSSYAHSPVVPDIAFAANITVNATCGEPSQQRYCLIGKTSITQGDDRMCGVCDRLGRAHPAEMMVDGTTAWWQSPSLGEGKQYDYVTIDIDLHKIYSIVSLKLKSAISPRPRDWILERSVDGRIFSPWRYFARSTAQCWLKYRIVSKSRRLLKDDAVTCTSDFSSLDPLQNGEAFTSARYIRIRLQKIHITNADEVTIATNRWSDMSPDMLRRYFYSFQSLTVAVQCECNGHAWGCVMDRTRKELVCNCQSNTRGRTCSTCCPLFNQLPWKRGNSRYQQGCEECECHGHAGSCVYNETVARNGRSLNARGERSGGGLCISCRNNTTGVNCESCVSGHYRPARASPRLPCYPCGCVGVGATGQCIPDDRNRTMMAGACICRRGYSGSRCSACTRGYGAYPRCRPCLCQPAGSVNLQPCNRCHCKKYVTGRNCAQCLPGFFNLDPDNREGCTPCFCFGLTPDCVTSTYGRNDIRKMRGWRIFTPYRDRGDTFTRPHHRSGWLVYRHHLSVHTEPPIRYWTAPSAYLGNRILSYGGTFKYSLKYKKDDRIRPPYHMAEHDVIMKGDNSTIVRKGGLYHDKMRHTVRISFTELNWFKRDQTGFFTESVTKQEFMTVIADVRALKIRAMYHSGQSTVWLKDVVLESLDASSHNNLTLHSVEQCECPLGYAGSSCESCSEGYKRLGGSGDCVKCRCKDNTHKCHPSDCLIACACHPRGSSDNLCSPTTGQCHCDSGYTGHACHACSPGYHDFPRCMPCACDPRGVNTSACLHDICGCSQGGQCACKANVKGLKCDTCRAGTFDLSAKHQRGCLPCFCLNRTSQCKAAEFDWLTRESHDMATKVWTESRNLLKLKSGVYSIPYNASTVFVWAGLYNWPIYWTLPKDFITDMMMSYGGQLQFTIHYERPKRERRRYHTMADHRRAAIWVAPVILVGRKVRLRYTAQYPRLTTLSHFTIALNEHKWDTLDHREAVSRELLMTVLHNLQSIYILAAPDARVAALSVTNITVTRAVESGTGGEAVTVERCRCPPIYRGTSCQIPAPGYTETHTKTHTKIHTKTHTKTHTYAHTEPILHAVPCMCHNHSQQCHPRTGVCRNCGDSTHGEHCQVCLPRHHGDATRGTPADCHQCACPLLQASNNFSPTCESAEAGGYNCTHCEVGHTGRHCERCATGFYGNPLSVGGRCERCRCSVEGSVSQLCDRGTGRCECIEGVHGHHCTQCRRGYAFRDGQCASCDDGCTGLLKLIVDNATLGLMEIERDSQNTYTPQAELRGYEMRLVKLQNVPVDEGLITRLKLTYERIVKYMDQVTLYQDQATTHVMNRPSPPDLQVLSDVVSNVTYDINDTLTAIKGDLHTVRLLYKLDNGNETLIQTSEAWNEIMQILQDIRENNVTVNISLPYIPPPLTANRTLSHRDNITQSLAVITNQVQDLSNKLNYSTIMSLLSMANIRRDSFNLQLVQGEVELCLNEWQVIEDAMVIADYNLTTANVTLSAQFHSHKQAIERDLSRLEDANTKVQYSVDTDNATVSRAVSLAQRMDNHTMHLYRKVQYLNETSLETHGLAKIPLKAANVYKDIEAQVYMSLNASVQAVEDADEAIKIANADTLQKSVNQSVQYGSELLHMANSSLTGSLEDLTQRISKTRSGNVTEKFVAMNRSISVISNSLRKLPQNMTTRLDGLETRILSISNKSGHWAQIADSVIIKLQTEIYERIAVTNLLTEQAQQDEAQRDINVTNLCLGVTRLINATHLEIGRLAHFTQTVRNVSEKISLLEKQIEQARNVANMVKLGISGNGSCARLYTPPEYQGPSLSVTFKLRLSKLIDQMLLLLHNSPTEYLLIQYINGQITFTWDMGCGPTTLISSLPILLSDDDGQFWYSVLANRERGMGSLVVERVGVEGETATERSVNETLGVMNITHTTQLHVGGSSLTHSEVPVPARGRHQLYGCITDVSINGQPVGLYNFRQSARDACTPCYIHQDDVSNDGGHYFNGQGYISSGPLSNYMDDTYTISLIFKTFWPHSLLFYSGNEMLGDYISVELRNGRVLYQLYMGGWSHMKIETLASYNTNTWVKVVAERNKSSGSLSVNKEKITATVPGNNSGLNLRGSKVYVGGMPTDVRLNGVVESMFYARRRRRMSPTIPPPFTSYVGCMRDIQLGSTQAQPIDLTHARVVNVETGCKLRDQRIVGLQGDGFISPRVPLQPFNSLALTFQTKEPNGIILLAATLNVYRSQSLNLYDEDPGALLQVPAVTSNVRRQMWGMREGSLSVVLVDEVLLVNLTMWNMSVSLTGNSQLYHDDSPHVLSLNFSETRLSLHLDNKEEDHEELTVFMPLLVAYFGGGPVSITPPQLLFYVNTLLGFDGCLSNVIINRRQVTFEHSHTFRRADVGRCKTDHGSVTDGSTVLYSTSQPFSETTKSSHSSSPSRSTHSTPVTTTHEHTTIVTTSKPQLVSCASLPYFQNEDNALGLGSSPRSVTNGNTKDNLIEDRFNISFAFRTHHNEGMFFSLVRNNRHMPYLVAQLRGGIVMILYIRRDNTWSRIVSKTGHSHLADGHWHKMELSRSGGVLQLKLNRTHIYKGLVEHDPDLLSNMYLGGPWKSVKISNAVGHSLRGCIRDMRLNSKPFGMVNTTRTTGIGHCFKTIEPGVYFSGQAYSIYAKRFIIGSRLRVSVEFRTHAQNGVLLSTSGPTGSPAVALELVDGKLRLNIRNSHGTFSAVSNFTSNFTLCDNKWHHVQADINQNIYMIQVNRGWLRYALDPDGPTRDYTKYALFIGGFPDVALPQGASISKTNFHGCLRDLVLNGSPVDWFRLTQTYHLHIASCPAL